MNLLCTCRLDGCKHHTLQALLRAWCSTTSTPTADYSNGPTSQSISSDHSPRHGDVAQKWSIASQSHTSYSPAACLNCIPYSQFLLLVPVVPPLPSLKRTQIVRNHLDRILRRRNHRLIQMTGLFQNPLAKWADLAMVDIPST